MSVYKRKNEKKWTAEVKYVNPITKEICTKYKTNFIKKKDAMEWEGKIFKKLSSSGNMLFESLCEIYFDDIKLRLKETSLSSKIVVIKKYIIPFFGKYPINEISPTLIRKFQNEILLKNLSKNYMRFMENQLKAIFNFAVRYYDLPSSPMTKVEMVGSRKTIKEINVWTLDDFNKFIETVDDENLYVFFKLLFWTGMRTGEALALTIRDIDFQNKILNIDKTFTRLNKKDIVTSPKTESSIRKIKLTDDIINLLGDYIKGIFKPSPRLRIFQFLPSRSRIRKKFEEYIKKAGVHRLTLHDLRHSHATMLVNLNENIVAISKRLGHENIQMTLNTYSHLYKDSDEKMLDTLNKLEKNKTP